MCLLQLEQIADIIQSVATVAALALGGAWSYWLFVKRRQRHPHADMKHEITHRHIGLGKVLLHVDVKVSNIGAVLMPLVYLETRIQQVLPLPRGVAEAIEEGRDPVSAWATEVEWPLIQSHQQQFPAAECEIEPGERQGFQHDFIFDADVKTVEVYSYVMNERERDGTLVWDLTTLYDLTDTE